MDNHPPTTPEGTTVQPYPFRPAVHPAQADTLVHFCGRSRQAVGAVAQLSPPQRLDAIVGESRLLAFPPYGSTHPTVSFSESGPEGVAALLRSGQWAAWGCVFTRDWAWSQGGGPVWYVRDDHYQAVRSGLGEHLASWLVRTTPTAADWLHEREWRIPRPVGEPQLRLQSGDIRALLVEDPSWEPSVQNMLDVNPMTGDVEDVLQTPHIALVPRWWWDGTKIQELSPVPVRALY